MVRTLLQILTFLISFLAISNYSLQAQSLNDMSKLDVDNLSEQQITKIRQEIESKGLTFEQAAILAKARGATEVQVMKLKNRLLQTSNISATNSNPTTAPASSNLPPVKIDTREVVSIDENLSKIFGSTLFNSKNLTFDPDTNIPVPSNYTIGVGDELIITVWGNSQQDYSLIVSKEGTVNIPNVGIVSVVGKEYRLVKENILSKLTAIYSEMEGSNPQTYADVTVGKTRSIQVNIVGESNLPGTYSLPGTASVFNALFLSGGPNINGSFRNIQVIRDNKIVATVDIYDYLINKKLSGNINLRSQDVIFIPVYSIKATMSDGFKRNAIFEMKENETLADLLKYAGGFSESVSTDKLNIKRINSKGYEQITVDINNLNSCKIQNGDNIYVNKKGTKYTSSIEISGAIYEPGDYEFKNGMKLSALITQAGGLIPNYYSNRGLITRLDDKRFPSIIPFDVKQIQDGTADVELKAEDKIIIKNIFDIGEAKYIRIEGEVMSPGQFKYQKNMTLKDLIFIAGGMKESASEASVEIARRKTYVEASELSNKTVNLFTFEVNRDLKLSSEDQDFELMPYDYIYIRRAPSYEVQKTVTILGEVKYPGKYAIGTRDERISDLIERAGGLTDFAYPDAAWMDRGLDKRQKDLIRKINSQKERTDANLDINLEMNQLLELQLTSIIEEPGGEQDYTLKEGDVITIPVKKEEIWVNGAVLNPSGLVYVGKSLKKYIDGAGGFDKQAKKHKTFVIYPNGRSASTKGFLCRRYPNISPGSQIVVPLKPEKQGLSSYALQGWVTLAATIGSLAVTTVALLK